jgi:hypothetical protein
MGDAQTDTAFSVIDEVLLIEQIHNVEAEEKLLSMPGQRDDMSNRYIINGIGRTVGGVRLPSFDCGA